MITPGAAVATHALAFSARAYRALKPANEEKQGRLNHEYHGQISDTSQVILVLTAHIRPLL